MYCICIMSPCPHRQTRHRAARKRQAQEEWFMLDCNTSGYSIDPRVWVTTVNKAVRCSRVRLPGEERMVKMARTAW